MTKSNLVEGKGFNFSLPLPVTDGTQGRNLVAGTEAEAMRNAPCWLVLQGLLNLLFYATQYQLPKGGTVPCHMDLPT